MRHIMKCPKCEKYTLKEECCTQTVTVIPPKYSAEDKYAKYRRQYKEEQKEKKVE